ncbi:MAG TPA: RagB/SusD family nutrient uptake outer membrane protein [Chitinophaga sp.]|uniref:RagB/SusD family nutrient uptake outer membrane protein n=1 Tax=Chitinophaga sp. TaxID=1869181 RepID=UPI002BC37302|nr:RagB/SusD family nutrient uptake outer membrane protein [Chitinophaga sp.]HVI44252.1 RagB/SusD family nutrient uptake outer membrane protein [Chitinophaga sp.]
MRKYHIIFVLVVMMIAGCKKDFLEINPTDKVSQGSLLADSALFESFVTNRYLGVRLQEKEDVPGFGRGFTWAMWSSLSDEAIYNNDDNTWLVVRGQLAPENLGIAGTIWGRSYRSIRECNYALENISKVQMSDAHRKALVAELRFIRAYRYFDLVINYGGVVLMGDKVYNLTDNLSDDALFKRAAIKECVDYILAELDAAATGLPATNNDSWKLGRATNGAALALKARMALYAASPLYNAGTWAAAAAAAKAVIDLNRYSIYTGGYAKLFLAADNNEIIFERLYTKNASHFPLEIASSPNGYGAWGGNTPLQNLVDDYEMISGKPITDPASGYDAQNPYANRDPRLAASILYNGASFRGRAVETFLPGGKDSKDGNENWNTSKTGYYMRKFQNDDYPINNPWDVAGFQPWIYMRYAEILLDYAEAQNEAVGPDGTVYNAVNQVRQRAGVNMPPLPPGLSQTDMRTRIRNERRVELAFEEHRFYDVRRWKIAAATENVPAYGIDVAKSGSTLTYTRKVALSGRNFQQKHYWLPIPRAEIQASNNRIAQNEGY